MSIHHITINGRVIDKTRGTITWNGETTTLEPKVFQVLELLIENKGHVVGHEQLHEKVWPRSIYNPTLIQRSIGIIRKALGESEKPYQVIVTHPKRGYSLEMWEDKSSTLLAYLSWLFVAIAVAVFSSIGFIIKNDMSINAWQVSELLPLTSSNANETLVEISPNETLVAIVREHDSQFELQIGTIDSLSSTITIKSDNAISAIAWGANSETLLFLVNSATAAQFYKLELFQYSQNTSLLLSELKAISKLPNTWVDDIAWTNNHVYFVKSTDLASNIGVLNVNNGVIRTDDLQLSKGELQTISINENRNSLLVATTISPLKTRIELIDLDKMESELIGELTDIVLTVDWITENEILLNTGDQLYSMSLMGDLTSLTFPNDKEILDVDAGESGDTIFAILEDTDGDILQVDLSTFETLKLADSNGADFAGTLSTDKTKLAFISNRNGFEQIFVASEGQSKLLYGNNAERHWIGKLVWQKGKDAIIFFDGEHIQQVDASGQTRTLCKIEGTPLDLDSNEVLVLKANTSSQLVACNTEDNSQTILFNHPDLLDAKYLSDKRTVIALKNEVLLKHLNNQQTLFEFDGQLRSLFVREKTVYFQTAQGSVNQLWSFDIESNQKTKVTDLPTTFYKVFDYDIQNNAAYIQTFTHSSDAYQLTITKQ